MDELQKEIDAARLKVRTDSYPMSIGEIVNMYDDGDLKIRPEFQRLYRWTIFQKSRFIESILLGIPLPSIFVAQNEEGIWELVDGLQRISTILEFMGKLKKEDETSELYPPLKLISTDYLKKLQDKVWEGQEGDNNVIHKNIKRIFKREKIDIKILQRESETDTKFEIFQRLNTGGSKLSDQEVRNVLLLMVNANAQHWIENFAKNKDFIETLPISERQKNESYDNELVVRYLCLRNIPSNSLNPSLQDVAPYLNQFVTTILNNDYDYENEKKIFDKTFEYLNKYFGEKAFKKYNSEKKDYTGAISMPIFEMVSYGVSYAFEKNKVVKPEELEEKIIKAKKDRATKLSEDPALERNIRPIDRMKNMVKQGKELIGS
ncbi:DUF262 domain-containing protein [Commensalibacter sp. A3DC]|uniref:DUF262 domain-containing protein n=1 Tax=Commensalibacter sp. A3DC TaxID=3093920 RepID=UPI0039B5FD2F